MKIKCLTLAVLLAVSTQINAQGPGGGPGGGGQGGGRGQGGPGGPGAQGGGEDTLARLMALDKNSDGKLTEDEYTDSRLKPLLERADADKNKIVTREELTALMQREGQGGGQGFGGPGQAGPGGMGGGMGEGGRGFGGREGEFGGRGGRGGGMRGMMMRPGTVLPDFLVQELKLSEEQRSQLAKLQATVDAELAKILNQDQQAQLKQIGERRPEGGPGQGGRGGFEGGPGGPGQGGPGGFGPGGPGQGGPGPGGPGANNEFKPGEGRPKT